MHYRNGREAKNGDFRTYPRLNADDIAAILAEKGLDKRPAGK